MCELSSASVSDALERVLINDRCCIVYMLLLCAGHAERCAPRQAGVADVRAKQRPLVIVVIGRLVCFIAERNSEARWIFPRRIPLISGSFRGWNP